MSFRTYRKASSLVDYSSNTRECDRVQPILWKIYQQTWFFRTCTQALPDQFTILTACNPRSAITCDSDNEGRQQRLCEQLTAAGYKTESLLAGDRLKHYTEASVIADCQRDVAMDVCIECQQNAYFWVSDDQLWLMPGLLKQQPTQFALFSQRIIYDKNRP